MAKTRTRVRSETFSPQLIDGLMWELGRDALKRAAKTDSQLRERIVAAVFRYVFISALGGGRPLGMIAGFPEPRVELPDLRRSPQLPLPGVPLALDYYAAYQKAKELRPMRRRDRAKWERKLLSEFPDLTERDILQCENSSVTAFISVARKHDRALVTVERLVRRLPKAWDKLVRDTARAWDGHPDKLRALSDSLREWHSKGMIKGLRKASKSRTPAHRT